MAKIWQGSPLEAADAGGWVSWSRGYAHATDGKCRTGQEIGKYLLGERGRLANILADLNGCFSAFLSDGCSAIVITDRFGTVPVYLCPDRDGSMAVADNPWRVIGRLPRTPRVSASSLVDILHTGYVTGSGTLIEGVETAAPATVTRIEGQTVRAERYWTYGYRPEEISEAEAIDQLEEVLRSVITRARHTLEKLDAHPVLTLSGGLDSRLLAGLFFRDEQPVPDALSYGTADDPEVAVANKIAAALQMRCRVTPVGKEFLNDAFFARSVQDVGITTRLTCGIGAQSIVAAPDEVLVPGHTGDFISGGHLPAQAALVHDQAQLHRFLDNRHFRYPFSQRILGQVFELDSAQRLDSLMRTTASFDLNEDMFGLIDRWNVENRQRRLILMELRAYERKSPWILPFYDYELIDFFARIPHALRFGQYLYTKTALERVFVADAAALAAIPRVGKPLAVDASAAGRMRKGAAIPAVLTNSALALVPGVRALRARLKGMQCTRSGPDPLCHWYHTDGEVREFLNGKMRAITMAEIRSDRLLELAGRRHMPQELFQRLIVSAITVQDVLNQAQKVWMTAQESDTDEESP